MPTPKIPKKISAAPSKPGLLITFEGPEGSGKSTQLKLLAKQLENQGCGCNLLITREPGGTPIGEEIRHLLQHAATSHSMHPETELLLFAASRAQLVREVILPALNKNNIVLCDRFIDSTTVYQGAARNLPKKIVQTLNDFAANNLIPNLTILLDVPIEISLHRINSRKNTSLDRIEKETVEFYKHIREGYLALAKSFPQRFLVINGTQDEHTIAQHIWTTVKKRFF